MKILQLLVNGLLLGSVYAMVGLGMSMIFGIIGLTNLTFTMLGMFIIDKVGRKKLIYYGVSGMIVCLVAIGLIFAFHGGGIPLLIFFFLYIYMYF